MKNPIKYPSYKDSEVEWLHEIPSNWKIVKAKRIFREITIKNHPNEPLLAATQTKGVIPKSLYENTTVTATKNFETLKFVRKGDFVISLRSFQGGIEYAHYQGIISPAYTILEPQEEVVHKYYRYLLKSKHYISGLTLLVTGIREGQNIDTGKFKDSFLPLPSKEEQAKIAAFLDFKLTKIDRFIRKKKQLIKLLNEQKAAIINQAVTKGLDPNAKMKPSGIEWLGAIPEHWKISKIKYLADTYNGSTPKSSNSEYWNGDINWATPEDISKVKGGKISETNRKITKSGLESCGTTLLPTNSVILTTRAPIGNIAISGAEMCTNQGCKSLVPKSIISGKYLMFYLSAKKNVLDSLGRGTTFMELSTYSLKNLNIVYSPNEDEILQILNFIEDESQNIENIISTIEKEITLTQEYKTALIAEAVTGKIDVRDFEIPTSIEVEPYEELEDELSMVAEDEAEYETKDID